jgi:hypothetical protein
MKNLQQNEGVYFLANPDRHKNAKKADSYCIALRIVTESSRGRCSRNCP